MAKTFKIDNYDLSGGQNSETSPVFIRDNECELVQNYTVDKVGALTKRKGMSYLIGQTVNNKAVTGLYWFEDRIGTDYSNILVSVDTVIKKIVTNAWADSDTGLTSGKKICFTTFIDYVFRTDDGAGVMESSTDLTTWGTTNCLATLKPKFVTLWEDRVYALNDASATKYPSRIYWASFPSGAPLAITWDAANDYADINPDDNDEITWGEPFGKRLLIFKSKAIYRWTFGQVEPDRLIDVGQPKDARTVKVIAGICFFANESGVFAYIGTGQPTKISGKVQSFIENVSDFSKLVAEGDSDHYRLFVGDVTVDGKDYTNTMLVYTISLKAWHIETFPFPIKAMARAYKKTLGTTKIYDAIYAGDDDGFVYRLYTGSQDYLGTTAKAISAKAITKEYPLYNFPKTSFLDSMYVLSSKATGTKVNYRKDRGSWENWNDLKKRITSSSLSGRAATMQLSITDNSKKDSQVEGFSFQVRPEAGTIKND